MPLVIQSTADLLFLGGTWLRDESCTPARRKGPAGKHEAPQDKTHAMAVPFPSSLATTTTTSATQLSTFLVSIACIHQLP